LLEGRIFNDEDERARSRGGSGHDTWEDLFGNEPAGGQGSNIETGLYTVIGVLDKRKQPLAAARTRPTTWSISSGHLSQPAPEDKDMWVSVKYDDPKNKALVQEEIRELLRVRRKVRWRPTTTSRSSARLADEALGTTDRRTGSVHDRRLQRGLMVGGVGVMNIMLVS
jgi:putative ABC transport system permease protein